MQDHIECAQLLVVRFTIDFLNMSIVVVHIDQRACSQGSTISDAFRNVSTSSTGRRCWRSLSGWCLCMLTDIIAIGRELELACSINELLA